MEIEDIENNNESNLQECEKLRDEYLSGWQRSKADFLNYKKEEVERVEAITGYVRSKMILNALSIFDAMEKAKEHISVDLEKSEWFEGFLQIEKQFNDFLKQEGVEEIKAIGEQFNPELHEAIEQVDADGESGMVVEVLQKGYTINEKLLRPAKVRVSK